MKKLLCQFILALMILTLASPSFASTWFAQAATPATAVNIDTVGLWVPTSTGTCTGSGTALVWASRTNADIFYANGCTAITVDVDPALTTGKISTVGTGGTAGGNFLAVTSASPITITSPIESGTTPCLSITGSANANPALTIVGAVTGGSAASAYGISDSHTVGQVNLTGAVTAGSNGSAYGYYYNAATGSLQITGNVTAATAIGLYTGTVGATVIGDCAASTSATAQGCYAGSSGAITVTGNIIDTVKTVGASGYILWQPSSAQKYRRMVTSATPTYLYLSAGLGSDAGGTKITGANTAAALPTSVWFVNKDSNGTYTQGSASSGGGCSVGY
jgi:hypothetical protein